MKAEKIIDKAWRESGMTLTAVSRKTGLRYSVLQPSLKGRRELRADEFLAVPAFWAGPVEGGRA